MPLPIPGPHQDQIPGPDADLAMYAVNFHSNWVPANAGVTAPLAADIETASDNFSAALAASTSPSTRSPVSIGAKRDTRVALVVLLRQAIRAAISAYRAGLGTMTEPDLAILGIRAPDLVRTAVSAPVFGPAFSTVVASLGVHELRFSNVDQTTGIAISTRKIPYGCVGIQIERRHGTGDWEVIGVQKRLKQNYSTASFSTGTVIQYRGRYITGRGETSPVSNVLNAAAQ